MPQVTIQHPADMPFGEAVSYVEAARSFGWKETMVFVPNIEVTQPAPDQFVVRRIQPKGAPQKEGRRV
jgi:hypothetical protein